MDKNLEKTKGRPKLTDDEKMESAQKRKEYMREYHKNKYHTDDNYRTKKINSSLKTYYSKPNY